MGAITQCGLESHFLHLFTALGYSRLNPKLKSHVMTLLDAFIFNKKQRGSVALRIRYAGLCMNKVKRKGRFKFRWNYAHSKEMRIGPGALAGRIRHNNARKATITQLFKWEHGPGLQGCHRLRCG
jgi:hypothetical protein